MKNLLLFLPVLLAVCLCFLFAPLFVQNAEAANAANVPDVETMDVRLLPRLRPLQWLKGFRPLGGILRSCSLDGDQAESNASEVSSRVNLTQNTRIAESKSDLR